MSSKAKDSSAAVCRESVRPVAVFTVDTGYIVGSGDFGSTLQMPCKASADARLYACQCVRLRIGPKEGNFRGLSATPCASAHAFMWLPL
jgi:hypothetical protein